jgi:hypothetical protein
VSFKTPRPLFPDAGRPGERPFQDCASQKKQGQAACTDLSLKNIRRQSQQALAQRFAALGS